MFVRFLDLIENLMGRWVITSYLKVDYRTRRDGLNRVV